MPIRRYRPLLVHLPMSSRPSSKQQRKTPPLAFGMDRTLIWATILKSCWSNIPLSDSQISAIHPQHTQASIKRLLRQFQYFKQGNCVCTICLVQMSWLKCEDIIQMLSYCAPRIPGEMFELAVEAQRAGRGHWLDIRYFKLYSVSN